MKTSIIAVLLAVCFATVSVNAEAQSRANKRAAAERPVEATMAAPERGTGSSAMSFGLGISSLDAIPDRSVDGSPTAFGTGSVTGFISFTNLDTLQILASIPSTSGTFRFGIAGLFKHTLFGSHASGFHLGGGLGLGTNGDFAMTLSGLIGVHYTLSGTNIAFHFDGGPAFSLTKSPSATIPGGGTAGGSTQTSLTIGQYSSVLGASVAYMF